MMMAPRILYPGGFVRQSRVSPVHLPPWATRTEERTPHTPPATTYVRENNKNTGRFFVADGDTNDPRTPKRYLTRCASKKSTKQPLSSSCSLPPPFPAPATFQDTLFEATRTHCTSQIHKTIDLGRPRGTTGRRGYRTRALLPPLPPPFLRSPAVAGEEGATTAAAAEGAPSVSPRSLRSR